MRTKEQQTLLADFAIKLLADGFRVATTNSKHFAYLLFSSNGKDVGYCQIDDLTGEFRFRTVHRPSPTNGTGFQYHETSRPDTQLARDCARCVRPHWVSGTVRKWRDFDAYLAEPLNRSLTELSTGCDWLNEHATTTD